MPRAPAKQPHQRFSKIHTTKATIATRLTFGEIGLPSAWPFGNNSYAVQPVCQSGFVNWEEPPDESAKAINMPHSSNPTNRRYALELKHTRVLRPCPRAELACLTGISLGNLHEVSPNRSIIVLVTDWEQSKAIEKAAKELAPLPIGMLNIEVGSYSILWIGFAFRQREAWNLSPQKRPRRDCKLNCRSTE